MKKRILSILLLCCMVLTLLPTAAFAANELPDVKLSVPATFDKTVDLTKQNGELKIKDSKTYLIKGSADPNWYFQYRIKIDGKGKNITPHIFLDGVRLQAPKDGPAIELYGGASACLYFIGGDSELIGAENFAALQKNKTDGYLRVLVQTGTKLTCEGGRYGAGIGGSKVGIKKFSQGHGMNLHFGSLATGIYGGEILATSGVYGAGIGGGQGGVGEWIYVYSGKLTVRSVSEGAGIGGGQGGVGEWIYVYSGKLTVRSVSEGAGIGGGQGGVGRFIYIKGGTVNAGSESGGAGIGSGDQDGQNKSEDAHHIEISGGTVEAWSNYAGAGIGGGRNGSGRDISITGGVVRAQGYLGAGIGGGMNGDSGNILIKDTTLTALAFPLYQDYGYTELSASAVGRGSNRAYYMAVMQDQEFAMIIEENIKIGASDGKSVWLSATGWQWRHNQEPYKKYWGTTTELLIPNENGRVDLQRLSLPYAYNYGRVISKLELRCEESTCSHELGWTDRDGCHIWACVKCGARDPAAEMSKQNAKHIPGDWSKQKQLCTVCGYVMGTDTKAPVLEGLKNGESYTIEDDIDGNPGAYTFTVSDPAESGETSSGIKSVTINGVPQTGPIYRLPAPDGGNNDAGAEHTVVATDNAGNETTATVRTYRLHHVKVISPDGKKTYADLMLPHNEYLVLQIRLPAGVSATLTDEADRATIPYDKENGEFRVGLITKNRTLVLNYSAKHPKVELRLGTGQYFTGYNADSDEPYYLKGASMDGNSYQIGMWVDTDAKPGYYLSSPNRYTQEELAALDESLWKEYKIAEATPGSIVLPFILITIDAAEYKENGGWYVYAKATNPTGTTYVSTPKIIIDVENPKAIDFSTGKELVSNGKYWGDLRFTVEDSSPVTVRHYTSPGGTAELLTPDEKGVYTISAEYDGSTQHMLVIEDACGNTTSYKSFKVCWNYLINVREKDHWDAPPAQPIRISKGQNLQEALSNINIGFFAADTNGWIPVDVSWKIPDDYDPQSRREQTFTVLGTVVLEGTGARCPSGLDVVPRPGEEWKKNISVQVTVEGDPQYKVTVQDCENGRVKVVNAAGTAEDGTPLFFKGELVMLSIDPDEGYMLSTLSVNGNPAAVAVGDDTYTFTQPEGDVTITAAFEMRNEHTVTFDANGGSEPEELPEEVTTAMPAKKILHGSEYSLPECEFIAPEGKQFKAWQIDGTEYPVNAPVTVTADITVKALWENVSYTITFDTAGGSTVAPITQDYGTQIAAPANPTREGYTFIGWDKAIPATMPAENMTIKAQWKINQYTITFDTAGGSETAPITQDYGTAITAPANPTKEGYTFIGWDKAIPATMPAENVTITAKWKVNQYTITFDTAGGSETAPITQDYGTAITAPADPTREGYTFLGWDKAIPATMPAENMTITAQWKVNQYTITFDTAGGSAVAPITQNYGTAITAPESPTREGYTFIGWDKTIPTTMPAENMTIKARWKDIEKPKGEIIIGTNKWSEFLNELTSGLFFKDTQEVTINAADNSGIVFVSYLVTNQDLSEAELKSLVFGGYEDPFRIEPNGEYIVYVMLVDASMNITYLRSDRITLDNIQPVIDGIENGKTYCEAQTVTINEKYIDTVTVNGTAVTLDENGSFVLSPANGNQKIVVTDKAGNTAEMTVTVNDGHTLLADDNDCTTPVYCKFCNAEVIAAKSHRFTGNWQNDETDHWHICQNENCTVTDRKTAHSGEDDGNCLTAVVCECGYVITAAKPAHMFNEWTSNGNGTHNRKCTVVGCNCIETENCSGGKVTCTERAVCTVCHTGYGDTLGHNFTIAQHDETHHWNKCSRCDATDAKAVHTGGTATCREKAVCEVCRSAYGKLSATNHVGGTEIRDAKPQSCTENGYTGDTYCKGCGEKLSSGTVIHADGHKGGTATCTDKAECEVCHEKYGEPDANHHTGMEMVDAVPATAASTGTVAHWRCTACGKLFADADGKREIRSEDTVTKKLAPSILDGANGEWRKGDENGLTFSSDAAFSDFVEVLVDGKTVASENYERQGGGTKRLLHTDISIRQTFRGKRKTQFRTF